MNYIHYLTFTAITKCKRSSTSRVFIFISSHHTSSCRELNASINKKMLTPTPRQNIFLYSLVDWQWQTNKQILLYVTDTVSLAFLQEVDVAFCWLVSSFYCDCEIYFLYLKLIFINLFISESQNCIKAVKTLIPISCPTTTPKWWHNKHSMSSFFLTNLSCFFCSSQSYM